MSRVSDALMGGYARRLARWLRGPRFTSPPRTPAERRAQYERDGFVAGGELADP